jgi:hypothetical protein
LRIRQEEDRKGWTHIDWELEGVTPKMLNWFWSNMDKAFFLWHPGQHTAFYWTIPPKHGQALGAIHVAPQVWADGTKIEPHIRFEDVATLPQEIADIIVYDHAVIAVGICLKKEDYKPDNKPIAYRVHQWEKTDSGVKGISTAIPVTDDPLETERGLIWAEHASEEVGNWANFLPELYKLYSVVNNTEVNPYFSFKVTREGKQLNYLEK